VNQICEVSDEQEIDPVLCYLFFSDDFGKRVAFCGGMANPFRLMNSKAFHRNVAQSFLTIIAK
jgi:hypothetical protein